MTLPASPTLNQIATSNGVSYKATAISPVVIWEKQIASGSDASALTVGNLNAARMPSGSAVPYSVTNVALSTPPGVNGSYFIKAPGTGAWAGRDNQIATTTDNGATWSFASLVEGQKVYDQATSNTFTVTAAGPLRAGYVAATTPPANPNDGDQWKNTATTMVSGVGPGMTAIRRGTAWAQTSTASLTVYSTGTQSIAPNVQTAMTDLTNVVGVNNFGAASLVAGAFTVPAGQGGVPFTIGGSVLFGFTGVATTIGNLYINNVFVAQVAGDSGGSATTGPAASAGTVTRQLADGDVVTFKVSHSNASALTAVASTTFMHIVRHPG